MGGYVLRRLAPFAVAAAVLAVAPAAPAAVDSSVTTNGTLAVTADGALSVTIGCDGGNVSVNGAVDGTACSAVTGIDVTGGGGANAIDLSGVTPAAFTSLPADAPATYVDGGGGRDSILGSDLGDVIVLRDSSGADGRLGDDAYIVPADSGLAYLDDDGGDDSASFLGTTRDDTFVFTAGAFDVGTTAGFSSTSVPDGTIESLILDGDAGDDTFEIAWNAIVRYLAVYGGTGDDSLTLFPTDCSGVATSPNPYGGVDIVRGEKTVYVAADVESVDPSCAAAAPAAGPAATPPGSGEVVSRAAEVAVTPAAQPAAQQLLPAGPVHLTLAGGAPVGRLKVKRVGDVGLLVVPLEVDQAASLRADALLPNGREVPLLRGSGLGSTALRSGGSSVATSVDAAGTLRLVVHLRWADLKKGKGYVLRATAKGRDGRRASIWIPFHV